MEAKDSRKIRRREVGAYHSLGALISVHPTPPGKPTLSFPIKLSPPTSSPPFLSNSSSRYSEMAAVARSLRPFASRALAQKPLAPVSRAAPAFRFPRGTRCFSQSPLGELSCLQSLSMESKGAFEMTFVLCF